MTTKTVIDVESDELTPKESTHLDNLSFELANEAIVLVLKRDYRSVVPKKKQIPLKMLNKNIKIEKRLSLM